MVCFFCVFTINLPEIIVNTVFLHCSKQKQAETSAIKRKHFGLFLFNYQTIYSKSASA